MNNLKTNRIFSLVLGMVISWMGLIAPLSGSASANYPQTIACPTKVVTSISPATGDASTPQTIDIVVSNTTYFTISGGEVVFLSTGDAFAVDAADPGNVIAGDFVAFQMLPGCCVDGFNPLLIRARFNFGSANACKTFNFYVNTKCLGTTVIGQSEIGGSFTLDCPFAALTAKVKLDRGLVPGDDKFDVQATLILAPTSNGIDLLTEDLTLQLGAFSSTVPAGSFTQGNNGRFRFAGMIAGVSLDVDMRSLRGGGFDLQASGEHANLAGAVNPLSVKLLIGGDSGSTTVNAKIK
jgi:hypothetical protein